MRCLSVLSPAVHARSVCCFVVLAIGYAQILASSLAQEAQQPLAASSASILWVNEPSEKDLPLPPGVQHLRFRSELVGREISYCVYLPTDYQADLNRRFPVIYNLHGNGGNEFTGLAAYRGGSVMPTSSSKLLSRLIPSSFRCSIAA